jgi:hypothetical protein
MVGGRRVARRTARRTSRRTTRRTARRVMRRRMLVGGMVVLAAGGTAAAIKLTQQDAQRIEQHTGAPPEELTDEELQGAMQDLGIQSQPVTAEDQAALGGAPAAPVAPATAETAAVAAAPQESYLDELERLADLRDRGIISDDDFEAKKRQLLGL